MAVKPPSLADFFPAGKTLDQWKQINNGVGIKVDTVRDYDRFVKNSQTPGTVANQIVNFYGSPEAYRKASQQYDLAYAKYVADFRQERADNVAKNPTASPDYVEAAQRQADKARAAIENVSTKQSLFDQQLVERRQQNFNNVRSQLENQYNNLQRADSRFGYAGRNADLNAVFNQQTQQLVDAGVTDISKLRIQGGRLVDISTGKTVNTSNLGGQVYTDRDTGVQKWGDIFSGVEGGANYGIIEAPDGSVLLFPAWEKTKSPIAQIGLSGLESFITPILTIGGAVIGAGPAGSVAGAALGAGAGSTVGQLLASGEVDWEKVALSAAGAGAGQAIFGPGASGAGEAGGSGISAGTISETGLLPGTISETGLLPPAGFELAPNIGAGAGAGLLGPSEIDLLGGTDFSKIGETGISGAPSTSASVYDPFATAAPGVGEGITVLPPSVPGGAATIAGLEAPGLSSMGGAQGITVPIQGGGVVSEMGFVPPGATPSLGDPASFINNPDYLGSPVISEDYLGLTASDMPTGTGIQDALRVARTGMQLFGGQQQQGLLGGGTAPYQAQGVDYSGLLSLLQGKARTPGVSPLIAPVASLVARPYEPLLGQQPQYQSLLGRTQQSLLG